MTVITAVFLVAVVAIIATARVFRARANAAKDGYRELLEKITEQQGTLVDELTDMKSRVASMEKMMREIE